MKRVDLSTARWIVRPVGDLSPVPQEIFQRLSAGIPAAVPGCIHTDLIRAGVIRDPRFGFAEREQFWVGHTDWRYECQFDAADELFEHDRIDLVCEGLDTVASLELNGAPLGAAANMFHPHRFDLERANLRRGRNTLAINFSSPLRHIRAEEARLGPRPVNGDWDPYIFIRKAAYNFGWDWAPKTPTCGIWKLICLEAWTGVRLASVLPLTTRHAGEWSLDIAIDLEWAPDAPADEYRIGACLRDDDELDDWDAETPSPGTARIDLQIPVRDPRLWCPRGHGEPFLHTLDIAVYGGDEPWGIADGWEGKIGFRDIRLDTSPDEHGSRFTLIVNDKPIFCRGANWVPDSLFPTEMTRDRYRQRLAQAADANMNMLRVWGGGYYEDDAFYDICDELGILIWQDFMFACAMYPEEPPYPALVEAEARHQISRLSSHASVALWCGGNECVWAYQAWGNAPGERPWKDRVDGKSWGRGYYLDLLPRLMAELDPTRPYWPNSPWPGSWELPSNNAAHGDRHTWDARAEGYRTIIPRFCSEFGHQSPPNLPTLARVIDPAELALGSQALEHRQRATGGTAAHINAALAEHYPPTTEFHEWHRQAQEMQASALAIGIESLAAARPRCMGALIWQLNDCWPGFSWSLIDSDGVPKPAYFAVQRAFGHIKP